MSPRELNRHETPPFLVKVFYRTGAFHRPEEFNAHAVPPHLQIHTWPNCTLSELSDHIASASPPVLPDPAVGTRLCFSLIYADTRGGRRTDLPPRYVSKFLGSVVLQGSGMQDPPPPSPPPPPLGVGEDDGDGDDEARMTLADARFITGDFISCAILPPDELTGDVVLASSARLGRGAGVGEARGGYGGDNGGDGGAPPPFSGSRRGSYGGPPPGGFRGRGHRGGGNSRGYGGGGRYRERDEPFGRGAARIPDGDWRRGDRLPDEPPRGGRWGR
ncbi:Sin3 associated polypeptide p18-domain-containing protein [Corynascus similis CBS 632.67]